MAWTEAESVSKAGRPAGPDPGLLFLLESLDVDLRRHNVPPNIAARADVTRVLFGGTTRNFPADAKDGPVVYGYLDGLGYEPASAHAGLALPAGVPLPGPAGTRRRAEPGGRGPAQHLVGGPGTESPGQQPYRKAGPG